MKLRKTVVLMLMVASSVFMTACNATTAESVAADDVSEEKVSVEDDMAEEVSVEDFTEETLAEETSVKSSVPEEPMVELAAGFDEEFTIKLGDNIYVGREDTSIFLKEIIYFDDSGKTLIIYQLKIGETVHEGEGTWSEETGGTIKQDVYATNRVRFIRADKDDNVTLMITSGKEVKEPLSLSGNAEDEYVTTQQEYIESDDFILFLEKDIKVYGNTVEQIKIIIELVEKEMGFKLVNDSRFVLQREREVEWLYGKDAFDGVDPNMEKFHIYVASGDKCSPRCFSYSIVVNQEDLEIAAGEGMAFVHELTHAVQFANGVDMGTTMNEGIATYITGQICDRDEIIPFNFDTEFSYPCEDVKVNAENAEQEFMREYGDDRSSYIYGYQFISFLCETYGENIYQDIFIEATERAGKSATVLSGSALTSIIKEKTSEDVFEKFVEWIEEKQESSDN